MQKDYWNIAKRNFRAMAIIALVLTLFSILGVTSANNYNVALPMLIMEAFFVVTTVVLFIIASLFKKKSPKAIVVAYWYLGISLAFSLVDYFILNSPSQFLQGIIYKILGYLILIYLFDNVHKAAQQKIA